MSTRPEQDLALSFAVAVRTAAYYEPENAVMRQSATLLLALLVEQLPEEGSLTVAVHSHCVFVQKTRIRSSLATFSRFAYLIDLYDSWGIKALSFFPGLSEAELMQALKILAREKDRSCEGLSLKLREAQVRNVQVDLLGPAGISPVAVAPVEAYAACRQIAEDMQADAMTTEATGLRQLRHVTQAVVDQVLSDPHSLIALTTIKDFDHYLISHSTNVAILSVVLGQRLGLTKARLGELCLAAFLHDAGKLEIDADILAKPGGLTEEEWQRMRRHPALGTKVLLSRLQPGVSSMRAVVVAFEHHLRYDLGGYPATWAKKELTLFGRIVSIADVFDAMTTARVYREHNFTPYEALDHLFKHSGSSFDPVLVKLFAEMMGLYPLGTVVELTTGELAVVVQPPVPGGSLDRPQVRVIQGAGPDSVLDLGEQDAGGFLRSVKHVVNPANMGLVPAVAASLFAEAEVACDVGSHITNR
jgi:HD-GYP domain-containing protein (c-di-GMP phosphodiesterase class II)